MAARGRRTTIACRRGGPLEARAASGGRRRSTRSASAATSGRRRFSRSRGSCAARRPASLVLHDPHAVSAGLLATRLAGRRPLVAVRRVDFPLASPLSRRKYAACDRVVVVSRAIGRVVEAGGVPAARLRLVYEGVVDRAPAPGGREALAGARRPRRRPGRRQRGGAHGPQGPRDARRGDGAPAAARARGAARDLRRGRAAGRPRGAGARARPRGPRRLRRLPPRPRPPDAGVLGLLPLVAPRGPRHEPSRRDGLRPPDRRHGGRRDSRGRRGRRQRPPRAAARRSGARARRSPRFSATRRAGARTARPAAASSSSASPPSAWSTPRWRVLAEVA